MMTDAGLERLFDAVVDKGCDNCNVIAFCPLHTAASALLGMLEKILAFKPTDTFEVDWTVGEAGHTEDYSDALDIARETIKLIKEGN